MSIITNSVAIEVKTVEEAPNYSANPTEFRVLKIKKVIVIKDGMESGNPSFDVQLEDGDGTKYLALVTGNIMRAIAIAANPFYQDGGPSMPQ